MKQLSKVEDIRSPMLVGDIQPQPLQEIKPEWQKPFFIYILLEKPWVAEVVSITQD